MPKKKLSQGMTQVYTGNGKGKTTAAMGLALRAAGYGYKSYIIQFMKGPVEYGELKAAEKLAPYLTIRQMGRECFVKRLKADPEDIKAARNAFALAQEVLSGGEYNIVILDEINVAVDFGLIQKEEVLKLMDERPSNVELILTGRYATQEIIERADLVTEMVDIKHYFQKGVCNRVGIDK
jgi:cob(I)alamin adenosyltransferase